MNRIESIMFVAPHTKTVRVLVAAVCLSALVLYAKPSRTQSRQLTQQGAGPNTTNSKRVALVIGNGAYTSAPPLKNPPNDARDMARTLKDLGFDVASGINVNQKEMKRLIREFGMKLKGGGGSGLFYYAGHGVQSKGRNFLIPIDADIQSEAEVEDSTVDVNLVLGYMDDAQNGVNIVILDACRNNPFSRSFRSASSGLAQVDAPTGTLIAYATAPGRVASDGQGQNGLYTSELLKQMSVPGLSVSDLFMRVRAEVIKQTAGKQVPWEASSLVGSFSFNQAASAGPSASNNPSNTSDRSGDYALELAYWDSIKNSTNPNDFQAYLKKYPNGNFAELARNRLAATPAVSLASCFASDPGAGSTIWNSHYSWAQNQNPQKLQTAIEQKLDSLFQCSSVTDQQAFDFFAAISVIIARDVPNAACFNGDEGVVGTDPAGHRNWAKERGRQVALDNLKSKAIAALNCLNASKRAAYYADVSVLAAGGALK